MVASSAVVGGFAKGTSHANIPKLMAKFESIANTVSDLVYFPEDAAE